MASIFLCISDNWSQTCTAYPPSCKIFATGEVTKDKESKESSFPTEWYHLIRKDQPRRQRQMPCH